MKADNLATLANDLIDAKKAADAISDPSSDGGPCNFDSPTLMGLRITEAQIDNIREITGVSLNRFTWFGRVAYWVATGSYGQGDNNTRTARAACDVLKAKGWDCTMYYAMD